MLFLPAPPRQCIDLHFEENYSIESSWECKFDNIEVRDGPFGFSPILGRYCGQHSPPDIRSSGRYLWIKFVTDGELEAVGFSASYNFTAGTGDASLPRVSWLLWRRLVVPSIFFFAHSRGRLFPFEKALSLAGDWFLLVFSLLISAKKWSDVCFCTHFWGLEEAESKLIGVVKHNGGVSVVCKSRSFATRLIFGCLPVTGVMRALMARNRGITWFNNLTPTLDWV